MDKGRVSNNFSVAFLVAIVVNKYKCISIHIVTHRRHGNKTTFLSRRQSRLSYDYISYPSVC